MGRPIIIGTVLIVLAGTGTAGYHFLAPKPDKNPLLTLYGNVDIRQVSLGFRVFGRVEKLAFEEGDRVKKGELLARLEQRPYLNKVNAARADLAQKKAAHTNAAHISGRKKKLLPSQFASVEEYENAKATTEGTFAQIQGSQAALDTALTDLQDTHLLAPSEGTILSRVRETGAIVGTGETVYVLSLENPMWVRAYISEKDLGRVSLGMKALVYTDSNPEKPYKGQVGFISPVAEFTPKNIETEELRTKLVYRLRVMIDNPDRLLRQGMPVTVRLKTD